MKTTFSLTITIIICFCGLNQAEAGHLQSVRDTVKLSKLLRQIAKEKVFLIHDEQGSNQQTNFRRFSQSATPYEFMKIAMENKNPIVRLYAFRAVAERMDDLPVELVEKFKNDHTPVTVGEADIEREMPLSEVANGFLK